MIHPLDKALEHARKGEFDESYDILQTMPDDPRAQFNMGWHEMRKGNLLAGMQGLSVGRWLNCFGSPPVKTDKPIWRGEDLAGKKILLRGEGGFGDEIINVRFARNFKDLGAYVTVSCSRSLMPLFRILPYVDALVEAPEAADFDFWVPAMSAPLVLELEYCDLSGDAYIPKPETHLLPDFRVGLKWSGNPQFEWEQLRRFPKEDMFSLVDVGPTFYSLQKEENEGLPDSVIDLAPCLTDWLATARIVAGLDLVITSCTSIAHLAGAMGVPVWVVVPICPYYVWALQGSVSPWYDSVKLYRQTVQGWPFPQIHSDLKAFHGSVLPRCQRTG